MRLLKAEDQFVRWWELADGFYQSWYADGIKAKKYYDGEQLDQELKAALASRSQPATVVNHIKPTVEMILGTAAKLRRNITCIPRASDDNKRAFAAAQAISYVQDINDFNGVQLKALADAVISGVGWYEVSRNTNVTQDPIRVSWVDWREMRYDPLSKQDDLSDARFIARAKWIDKDLAVQLVPQIKSKIAHILGQPFALGQQALYQQPYVLGDDIIYEAEGLDFIWYNEKARLVRMIEFWYRSYERRPVIYIGSQFVPFDQTQHAELLQQGVPVTIGVIPIIKTAMIVGPYLAYDVDSPYKHGFFPYVPIYAFRDYKGHPYGVVKPLIDPQDEINKRRSKLLHMLNTMLVVLDQGAVEDIEEVRREVARPDGVIEKRQGMDFELIRHDKVSKMHYDLMLEAIQEIRQISGQYGDSRGEETNARTGLAIKSRTINAQTSIATLFANNSSSMRRVAELILSMVKTYYTTERVIRLAGPEARTVTLNTPVMNQETGEMMIENAMSDLLADVVLADQPTTFSERQAIMATMSETLKGLPPMVLLPLLPFFFDMMDVPNKDEMIQVVNAIIGGMQNNVEKPGAGASRGSAERGTGREQGQRRQGGPGGPRPIPNNSSGGKGVITFPR